MARPRTERDPLRAAQLKKAREARNLTQTGLERLAGVSRKHISDAEQGVNISLAVLTKLMRALGMREITVAGDLSVRAAGGADSDLMLEVADQIERAADDVVVTLSGLATFIRGQQPAESADDAAKLRMRAAALARRFAEEIRGARPEDLATLEATLNKVGAPSRKAAPAGRRKRAG
jgi:transcriptional regulator with XRE-family HTH domain